MNNDRSELDNAFDELQQALGEVTMSYGHLDDVLQEVIVRLVNPSIRNIGYVVFDLVAESHHRKLELITELLNAHCGMADNSEAKQRTKSQELSSCIDLIGKLKGVGKKRNDAIHSVYDCWMGKGLSFERRTLKKGRDRPLHERTGERITAEEIRALAREIRKLTKEFMQKTEKLLTKQLRVPLPAEGSRSPHR
jgi:hypothetical protein